ncbi:tetratricopeptide repeat protein [Kiloniella sp.]|uniref:tetratricopeptide repeat protein n=1 Tax=Kiloniella sp. TaxID=1938587 RepID=UPI003B01E7D3
MKIFSWILVLIFMVPGFTALAKGLDHKSNIDKLELACRNGKQAECTDLGDIYLLGKGVEQSDGKAFALYLKACEGQYLPGCTAFTRLIKEERGLEGNMAALLQFGCDRGDAETCFILGGMYMNGNEVKQDDTIAAKLFEQACDGDDAYGCSALAAMYLKGEGVNTDHQKAIALFKESCNSDNSLGCYGLANMYSKGLGVGKDLKRVKVLYQKACESGSENACQDIGLK